MSQNPPTEAELVVLSLIAEQPRHGYQIEQQVNDRNMRVWTKLASSSIYYLLNRLEQKGWIAPQSEQEPSGQGPPRKVFRLTIEGEQVWRQASLAALARPRPTYTNFLIGLHNSGGLPAKETLAAVRSYRQWLEADLARQHGELEGLEERNLAEFPVDLLFDYSFVLGEAELGFLDTLIGRLQARIQSD